jgi:hypothetical protein
MLLDRLQQIRRAAVVQEKDALPKAPKRCGTEFITRRLTLPDLILQSLAQFVELEVAERAEGDFAQRRQVRWPGLMSRHVAKVAAPPLYRRGTVPVPGGTNSSNPLPSSGESDANLRG